jgi:glycosyltransferase involved in cell wall biosynthesis
MNGIRVLHCPAMVGGNPQQLARAERELGLQSWAVALRQNRFQYQSDEVLCGDGESRLLLEVRRWRLLCRALREFDVVHFNFGETLMPQRVPPTAARGPGSSLLIRLHNLLYANPLDLRDLPLLKRAGKGIVMTYQGDDARQGDYCAKHFSVHASAEVEPGYYSAEGDRRKRRRIAKVAHYADRIFALNPDLLHVLPPGAQFLPYANCDLRTLQVQGASGSDVPVVVHAPTHRGVKGTRFILEAIDRLRRDGIPVELVLVEGVSQSEALRLYQRADLLVDQLLLGWYGGAAIECMAMGKPVICYIREDDLKFIPEQMRRDLPVINASPATIADVLREWLTVRRHELAAVGRRSREYVERWHDPLKIAAMLKTEYESILASKKHGNQR